MSISCVTLFCERCTKSDSRGDRVGKDPSARAARSHWISKGSKDTRLLELSQGKNTRNSQREDPSHSEESLAFGFGCSTRLAGFPS
eukprot:scaffold1638_cov258-Pinguiococcus_pyrenoidosus.AAC.8